MKDLVLSTVTSKVMSTNSDLNPLTQAAYLKISRLELRVREAIKTSRKYGLFPLTNLPSPDTTLSMPVYKHPYLGPKATDGMWCMTENHNITTVGQMPSPGTKIDRCKYCMMKNSNVQTRLKNAGWLRPHSTRPDDPEFTMDRFRMPYLTLPSRSGPTTDIQLPKLRHCRRNPNPPSPPGIWQPHLCPLDLIKIFTNPHNLLAAPELTNPNISAPVVYPTMTWSAPLLLTRGRHTPRHTLTPPRWNIGPRPTEPLMVEVWTDGSAENNSLPHCSAGIGWVSSTGMEYS
jgi:hypothetical protein